MENIERPAPIGEARHGPYYDTAEVALYRMALGVTQEDLARRLRTAQSYVSRIEGSKRPEIVQARTVEDMLDAIRAIVSIRQAMVAKGVDGLRELRGQGATPTVKGSKSASAG